VPGRKGPPDVSIATSIEEVESLLIEIAGNCHAPARTILTGVGALEVSRPRVDERNAIASDPERESFTSGALPRFLRRTSSLAAATVGRLKDVFSQEYEP
jgi:hypothetical protein